jgi:hypothetical protein
MGDFCCVITSTIKVEAVGAKTFCIMSCGFTPDDH